MNVSKGEFATIARVTPTRVGQWIREQKISGDALVGEGRFARINVERACEQLKLRRDVGQSLGNGLETRLDFGALPAPGANAVRKPDPEPADDITAGIRRERLRTLEYQNRTLAEAELARRGRYTRTDQVAAVLGKAAQDMVSLFEGALPDLASAIAGRFGIANRDVLHQLRQEFRQVRVNAAKAAAAATERLPTLTADAVDEELEAAN